MNVSSLSFDASAGWSGGLPDLDSDQTLVLVFGLPTLSGSAAEVALEELRCEYPNSLLLGCSSAGEIYGRDVRDGTLSVAIARFESTRLKYASAAIESADASFDAGRRIAQELTAPDLRSILVFSEGVDVNGSALVRGLKDHLPAGVVVTGGLAADGTRFRETWVLDAGRAVSRRVAAVGLYGSRVRVGHGSHGGWDIFGPLRRVTRSNANVLLEIDGQPALALYKKYLGDEAAKLPAAALHFPLAMRSTGDADMVVRTILSVDEATNTMTFAGDVPEGSLVQLMHANIEHLIDGACAAAKDTTGYGTPSSHSLAIAVSCVGRRLVLGERAEDEIEAVLRELPASTQLVGFYSYGEIAPGGRGECDLHNQTMTLTSVWES